MHCISLAILSRLSRFPLRQLAQIDLSVFLKKYITLMVWIRLNDQQPSSFRYHALTGIHYKTQSVFTHPLNIAIFADKR